MPHSLDAERANLLIVDDDITVIQVLAKTLHGIGSIRYALNGNDALRLVEQDPPDVILLDAHMPGMSGFEVLGAMRAQPHLEHVPAIFITSDSSQGMEEEGLAKGAADFIGKPFHPAVVAARVRTQLRLKRALDRLQRLSTTDPLTGVANRRTLDEKLLHECKRSQRSRSPISVLMLDVDHFKRFNDNYGHVAGDEALIQVARVMLASSNRPADLVARYGGEEFTLVLPDTDGAGAMTVATTLMESVARLQIPHVASVTGILTVSMGISCFDEASDHWNPSPIGLRASAMITSPLCATVLLTAADQALYAAKQGGRDSAVLQRVHGAVTS